MSPRAEREMRYFGKGGGKAWVTFRERLRCQVTPRRFGYAGREWACSTCCALLGGMARAKTTQPFINELGEVQAILAAMALPPLAYTGTRQQRIERTLAR
jgi:hypothetical protein